MAWPKMAGVARVSGPLPPTKIKAPKPVPVKALRFAKAAMPKTGMQPSRGVQLSAIGHSSYPAAKGWK